MDKKLQLIRHLYGEVEDSSDLQPLLEEPDLQSEYKALGDVKFWLDHAERDRPSDAVLETIRQAAAGNLPDPAPALNTSRQDRPPAARKRTFKSRFGAIASVFSLLVAVGIGWQLLSPSLQETSSLSNQKEMADQVMESEQLVGESDNAAGAFSIAEKSERLEEAAPELRQRVAADLEGVSPASGELNAGLATAPAPSVASVISPTDTMVPAWDDVEDLLRYRRRIQMLLEQSEDLRWDQPVPLEMLPGNRAPNSGVLQTRSRTSSTGNQ